MTTQSLRVLQQYWKPGSSKVLPLVILITLLILGSFFYLYVAQNYSYLVERNFRILATWSQELTETFDNYQQSFRFRVQEQKSTTLGPIQSPDAFQKLTNEGLVLNGFTLNTEENEKAKHTSKEILAQQTTAQISRLPFVKNVSVSEHAFEETSRDSHQHTVTFSHMEEQPNGLVNVHVREQDTTQTEVASASIVLQDLLEHVATEDIYEDILLADPSGAIVYQRNPSILKFLHLGNLLHHQKIRNGIFAEFFSESGIKQIKALNPKNLEHVMKSAMPSHFQMTVGGTSYEVFMQAVAFPSITTSLDQQFKDVPWIICGILPSSTFQEQYLAIPFTVLLLCLFLFISAFLALPVFSLSMMNPRERLTRFSVMSLLITNILGAGIGTLFLLDLGFYRQTVADFHERLRTSTDSISEAFHTQLDRMVWQLDRYNRQFQTLQDQDRFPQSLNSEAWLARVKLPDPCKDTESIDLPFCYPNFSVVFWADGKGILRETWTKDATPYVRGTHDLSQRDYITKAQGHSKQLYRRFIDNRWLEFYVQPLISLESSTRSLVVSMPYQTTSKDQISSTPWVGAIQSEDFSLLKKPVLSPGTGYAVIEDQTGLTVFHSDGRRMLRENFLEETDNNPKIAALIQARTAGEIEGKYWGNGHRFVIKPLAGLPWTLIVFENKEILRTTNFEMLLFSLSLFTMYILTLLLWFKILLLIYRSDALGQRIRWIWPKQQLRKSYRWLSLLQLVIFVLGLVALLGIDWLEEMAIASSIPLATLPFFTIWVVIRTLWKNQFRSNQESSEQNSNPWALLEISQLISTFARFALTSFLLLGVFPAILFFKVAHDQEMRLFSQHHLWGFAQSLVQETEGPWLAKGIGEDQSNFQLLTSPSECLIADCPTGIKSTPIMINTAACSPWNNVSTRPDFQASLQNVFASFPFATCLSFGSKSWNPQDVLRGSWLDRLHQLIRKSSLQNPNSKSWGFLHPVSSDTTANWAQLKTEGHQQVMLRLNDFPQGRQNPSAFGPLYLSLWTPLFPWNLSTRLVVLLFMAGLLLLIDYGILRYMIAKIYTFPSFFHRSHEIGAASVPQFSASLDHLLIVGPPGSGKSRLTLSLGTACSVLDIHKSYGKEVWAKELANSLPGQTSAVILDHFEYQWEDLVHRKEKGVLVEYMLSRGLKVCIFSTIDPLDWTRDRLQNQTDNPQDEMQTYWINLLGSFGFMHFIPNRMEALLQEWIHPQTEPPGTTGGILPVKHCLNQEALPTPHLEKVGKWVRTYQEWATWTPEQMKEQFLQIAWPYYQTLWQSCSLTEKLTLYHIAIDGYIHADNPELISLSQKGLIRLTPDLQLMNASFRQCVLQLGVNFQLSQWEKQTRSDTWGQLKWPFLFIFGTVLLFFFFTQQEFKNSFITLISLLPILLPALPDLPALLSGTKSTKGSPG